MATTTLDGATLATDAIHPSLVVLLDLIKAEAEVEVEAEVDSKARKEIGHAQIPGNARCVVILITNIFVIVVAM